MINPIEPTHCSGAPMGGFQIGRAHRKSLLKRCNYGFWAHIFISLPDTYFIGDTALTGNPRWSFTMLGDRTKAQAQSCSPFDFMCLAPWVSHPNPDESSEFAQLRDRSKGICGYGNLRNAAGESPYIFSYSHFWRCPLRLQPKMAHSFSSLRTNRCQ